MDFVMISSLYILSFNQRKKKRKNIYKTKRGIQEALNIRLVNTQKLTSLTTYLIN